jgi:LuxR family quorum sensing-dependent transcriptional regulator
MGSLAISSEMPDISRDAFALIDGIESLTGGDDIADAVFTFAARVGAEALVISSMPKPHELLEDVVMMTRGKLDWFQLYNREEFVRIDPLIYRLRRSRMPCMWSEVDYDPIREPRGHEVMNRRREFGLNEGFIVPICGPSGLRGFVSLGGVHVTLTSRTKKALHLVAIYAFTRIRSLRRTRPGAIAQITPREREVLTWTALGKSAWEIGEILDITKRTVDEHIQTAFRKLHAVNKTQAVAIALRDRIISLK